MKKNTILYLLLIVLIIMNSFFLYNYLGRPDHQSPKRPGDFIVQELNFNETQLKQFNKQEDSHHKKMKIIGDDIKIIKDELLKKMTAAFINNNEIDSLFNLIASKEVVMEKEMFTRLRNIFEICDDIQKKHFNEILKKARRFNDKGPSGPRGPR